MDRIFLHVENDVHSAKVTSVDHPYHHVYHVLFDDGYENIFFTDVETGNWIEEDLGETALATSFGTKVYLLERKIVKPPPNKSIAWCKAFAAEKLISFGFYTYVDTAGTSFEVYANNHKFLYLFTRSGTNWRVSDVSGLIDKNDYTKFIKIVISIFTGLAGSM